MEKWTVYPSKELAKRVKEEMTKEKRSLNNLLTLILEDYFRNKSKHDNKK